MYNQLIDAMGVWSQDERKSIETRNASLQALEKLVKYYEKTTKINIIATVMDPRLKVDYFRRQGWSNALGGNLMESVVKPTLVSTFVL